MKVHSLIICSLLTYSLIACRENTQTHPVGPTDSFRQSWYAGKAELSSYSLQQARYGEIRNGEAVIIFVTEDFSPSRFVKIDDPATTKDKVSVMKMNMTKTFQTGIYPYSMMLSVFKPISRDGLEKALKVTCSSQEWCGHTFSQLQLQANGYGWQLHSYFENEAGLTGIIDDASTEDEIWSHIRINPSTLPKGQVNMIPGLLWQRLSHKPAAGEKASITLSDAPLQQGLGLHAKVYAIHYPEIKRTLSISFRNVFPFEILGWQETYPDGFGSAKKVLTTKAVLKKSAWIDYWKFNSVADSAYLDTLQLMHHE